MAQTAAETSIAGRRARANKNDDYRARRAVLVEQAAQLFHTKGLAETSLSDIAGAAGLDRASIYYYFSNKEEIVAEVLREVLSESVEEQERIASGRGTPEQKLRRLVRSSMMMFDRHYPHLFVYVRADIERSLISEDLREFFLSHATRATAQWRRVIAEGVRKGVFHTDLSLDVATSAVLGAVTSAHWWYRPDGGHDPEAVAEGVARMLVDGLGGRGGE